MKRLRHVRLIPCALLALSLGLWGASTASAQAKAGYGYTAAEFMSDAEAATAFPTLAAQKVGLALPFPSSDLGAPTRLALVRQAAELGVEIRPWLLLPNDDGYWPNSTNAALFDSAARRLVEVWAAAGLKPTTFIVDMEMPLARTQRFAQLAAALDTDALASFLKAGIDRAQYASATKTYKDLVDYLHGKGWRVQITTLTQMVDDYDDFDDGLRQAFNVPLEGIAWDEVNVQVYRTLNSLVLQSTAGPTTSYFVYDYASRARRIWGARTSVSLGCTDPGDLAPTAPSYSNGAQLREDVDAAAAAGIARNLVGVYQLRGMVRRPPLSQWFPARSLIALPPFPDLPTFLTHASSAVLDAQM
ncbi:MAG: hypothetical protein JWN48_2586 [Myxococcaceae bacterium]|nr:hypothetical protein [Myxococcaceae bacterium]